ncbi:MAG: hypothetical protein NUV65_02275 [Candidatus Roizmanbacteria bacterium]|nr:hypothetical protein [Candidatus Roizmanbacteria bacterium]
MTTTEFYSKPIESAHAGHRRKDGKIRRTLSKLLVQALLLNSLVTGSGVVAQAGSSPETANPLSTASLIIGPETPLSGSPQLIITTGQSSRPDQNQITHLGALVADAVIADGLQPQNVTQIGVGSIPTDGIRIEPFGDDPFGKTSDFITQLIAESGGYVIINPIGHGEGAGDWQFSLTSESKMQIADFGKAIADGLLAWHNLHAGSIDKPLITMIIESCQSGSIMVPGPKEETPYTDKGETTLYYEIVRALEEKGVANPQGLFTLEIFTPTLPGFNTQGEQLTFNESVANAIATGGTFQNILPHFISVSDEIPMAQLDQHPINIGGTIAPTTRIHTVSNDAAHIVTAGNILVENGLAQLPIRVQNFAQDGFDVAISADTSPNIAADALSQHIIVSPESAGTVTVTLPTLNTSGTYTATLELEGSEGKFELDYDSRWIDASEPAVTMNPQDPIHHTYLYGKPYELVIPVVFPNKGDKSYTAWLYQGKDVIVKAREVLNPDDATRSEFIFKPKLDRVYSGFEGFVQVVDGDGNVVYGNEFISSGDNNDTIIDANATPLDAGTEYGGRISETADKDYYTIPEGTNTIKFSMQESQSTEVSYNVSFLNINTYSIGSLILHPGETISKAIPDGATHVVISSHTFLGNIQPEYGLNFSALDNLIFLPLVQR